MILLFLGSKSARKFSLHAEDCWLGVKEDRDSNSNFYLNRFENEIWGMCVIGVNYEGEEN